MEKIAVPLQQAKAARVLIQEGIDPNIVRVQQRPPNPFVGMGPQRQPIRVVNLRAEIVSHAPIILTVLEHGGHRRNAQAFNRLAREQMGFNLHHRHIPRRDHEGVGTGDARTVQQCMNCQIGSIRCRALQPETPESREFFRALHTGVNGQTPR